ncbi:lysylphosphatidylglycerol synthase transmembrane domain-containing protein [Floccifex sp.]|uniref:lysylphosphatidylglycerol synthase transmembrane domain-containing protein n=1 Tax=Floccifex sp. TaxID=2815810 RepID=UPI003EFD2FD5
MKKIILFIFIVLLFYFVFHDNAKEIKEMLFTISIFEIIFLLFMSIVNVFLEALSYWSVLYESNSSISILQAMKIALIGIFASTSTSSTGTVPAQSFAMSKMGVEPGFSVGSLIFSTVFYKTGIWIVSIVFFGFQWNWLKQNLGSVYFYIQIGFLIGFLFIFGLILLSSSKWIQNKLLWILDKFPSKWKKQKEKVSLFIHNLYEYSKFIFKNYKIGIRTTIIQIIRILWKGIMIYMCMRIVNIDYSFSKIIMISFFLYMISGFLPKIAGLGPVEVSYLMLYTSIIRIVPVKSSLLLFRIFDYFLPFLFSLIFVSIGGNHEN